MNNSIVVDIHISADEYLHYYSGSARDVVARSRDGRTVRFPAKILQRFVTRSGISGSFEIQFGADGRFQTVERWT